MNPPRALQPAKAPPLSVLVVGMSALFKWVLPRCVETLLACELVGHASDGLQTLDKLR